MRREKRSNVGWGLTVVGLLSLVMLAGCGPQPEEVQVTPKEITLTEGESAQYEAVALSKEGEKVPDAEIVWSVEGDAGSISEEGQFTARQPGEAFVIASVEDISGRSKVVVEAPAPELAQVEISPKEQTVTVGEKISFLGTALSTEDEKMPDVAIEWRSEGEAGSVNEKGEFEAERPGEAWVTAHADGFSAKSRVTVIPRRIAKIEVRPEKEKALPGSTIHIDVTGLSAEGEPAGYNQVSVSSPAEGASLTKKTLSLDESGQAKVAVTLPSQPGNVPLLFEAEGARQEIEIEGTRVTRIEISPGPGPYEAGQSLDFEATGYDDYGNYRPVDASWSVTGDMGVLEEGGKVRFEKPGKGILLAEYKDTTASQSFTVEPGELAEIRVTPKQATVKAGQVVNFTSETYNAHEYPLLVDLNWKVQGKIGLVTEEGLFQAKKAGKGQVVAYSGDLSAEASVEVEHGPLADVVLEIPKTSLKAGDTIELNAEGVDAYGNRFPVEAEWFLSKSIGFVDKEAKTFTARHAGKGEIRALVENVMESREVEVLPAELVQLEVTPAAIDLTAGETIQFEVRGFDDYDNRVETDPVFSIGKDLGELTGEGAFTAKRVGNTKVEVRVDDLMTESSVSVQPAEMVRVALEPSGPAELTAGESRQFNAYGFDRFGNIVNSEEDWEIFPALGRVDMRGNFLPKKAGKGTLQVEIRQVRTGKVMGAEVAVSVQPGRTARIKLEPSQLTVEAGLSADFSAAPYDEFGNETGAAVQWSLVGPELGTLNEKGVFRARKSGECQVRAGIGNVFALAEVEVVSSKISFLKVVPEEILLKAGEKVQLDAVGEDRFGNYVDPEATWSLSDPTLGRISSENVLIAEKEGKGFLLAVSRNLLDQAPVQVEKGPLNVIRISPSEAEVNAGEVLDFQAKGFDAGGNLLDITPQWAVDESLGSIDEDGKFQAKTVGAGGVTASADDVTGTAKIEILPGDPAEVKVKPAELTFPAGESRKISVEVLDQHGNVIENPSLRWEIEDRLGMLGPGNTFFARRQGRGSLRVISGKAAVEIPVTVEVGPLHRILVMPQAVEMPAGEKRTFTARGYDAFENQVEIDPNWAVSGGIGSIGEEGEFRALILGEGLILAQEGGVSGAASVTVSPGVVHRIQVIPEKIIMKAGEKINFQATAYDAYGNVVPSQFRWSLEKGKPGELNEQGGFTARKTGQGAIFAHADKVRGKAEIRVVPGSLAKISIVPADLVVTAGRQIPLEITGMDQYGNLKPVEPELEVTPASLGRIVDENVFESHEAGQGEITARADGVENSIPVEVTPGQLARIEIEGQKEEIKAGKSYPFAARGFDEGGNEVPVQAQWAADPEIGRIETATGVFHAQKTGEGLISAYSEGVASHQSITVRPGDLYSLFIRPNPVTVESGKTQTFTLEGTDVKENEVPLSVSAAAWEVAGQVGQIEEPGVFLGTRMGEGKAVASIGSLMAQAYVTVEPGQPDAEKSRVRVTHPILPADGTSHSQVIVQVRDSYNNPVPGVNVKVVSSRQVDSVLQPKETGKDGVTRARISSSEAGTSVVSVLLDGRAFEDGAEVTFK